MEEVKYPEVHVQLTDQDGNAYAILGRCRKAWREQDPGSYSEANWQEFYNEATSDDYPHLLQTVQRYFDVD